MYIVPGLASLSLGQEIADQLKVDTILVEYKNFPDGESYIRFTENLEGKDLAIIQSTGPPQDTHTIQLLFLIKTAKELGAKSVTAVTPYFAYARQMRRARPGECVSAKGTIELIESAGADRFITVNIHATEILDWFNIPTENLSAVPLLTNYLTQEGLDGAFAFAPDDGALGLAKEADKILKGGYGWLQKERDVVTGELDICEKNFDVKDREVVVIDDIISTGATTQAAINVLKKQKASKVYVAVVHPIFVEGAFERIMSAGAEGIVGTNSIPDKVNSISIAPIICKALKKLI